MENVADAGHQHGGTRLTGREKVLRETALRSIYDNTKVGLQSNWLGSAQRSEVTDRSDINGEALPRFILFTYFKFHQTLTISYQKIWCISFFFHTNNYLPGLEKGRGGGVAVAPF